MQEPSIEARIDQKSERLHISIGAICNNNCLFCMEEDRDARYVNNSAMTAERVRWMLEKHRPSLMATEEVCFTSGEPTTRPELLDFVKWAKELGYRRISMMTNGRRIGHLPYAVALAKAGMNRFYVSIHGHEKKLHEGLTRTPDSFEQTVAGLDAIAQLKKYGIELHTSTVVTERNYRHMAPIYRFLRSHGVDQVVFNVMQANGRADTYFEQIFPKYTAIAAEFAKMIAEVEPRPMAFLVDIPLCTTEGIPDFNRGYVEKYIHYDLEAVLPLPNLDLTTRRQEGKGKGLVVIGREDLDHERRDKRAECASCRYASQCEGVWATDLRRYGWDEMQPVLPARDAAE